MVTGFVGRDAETHTTRNDSSFTTLSVATKRSWKNRETGTYESQTTWHKCVVFGPQAVFAATLLKGTHVHIEGELRTREYTDQALRGEEVDYGNPRIPHRQARPGREA
jgi:single-strand DNA-binding protein